MSVSERQCEIRMYRGKPTVFYGGEPVTVPSYCCCMPGQPQAWQEATRRFAEHGRSIFWLMPTGGYNGEWGTTPFWTEPGVINDPPAPMPQEYVGLDRQVELALEVCPEARFFVRMMDRAPETWRDAHPDQMLQNDQGKLYDCPSYASDLYMEELGRFLEALTAYCERADWAGRILGYIIYPLGEGATPLACEGYLFDQSPAMNEAFRSFLAGKYGSDEALQRAWHDEAVTLQTARVPTDSDFRRRHPEGVLYWPEARQVQKERDYFECQKPLFRRYRATMINAFRAQAGPDRLCGFDACKGNMLGWMTHPIFRGKEWKTHYGDSILATGTTGMAEILDMDGLDILATPHDYRCRWVGFGYDPEGIGDSLQLHRRMMYVEEDQRSYASPERGLFGSIEPGEEEAILYRNLAASISKGQDTYPMDVCVGYFNAEPIQEALEVRQRLRQDFLHQPREEVPGVVMLVDDRSGYYTDFSAEYNDLAVIRQRIYGMNHCGVPTRTFLADDLARDNFPPCHKLFLLPNCYVASEAVQSLLRERLFRDGNVIVFGPGSGITDGEVTSPDSASALLGMDMELYDLEYPRFVTLDNWTHPLTRSCGACETYGDTHRYGPVLLPWDQDIECEAGIQPRRSAAAGDGSFTRLGTIPLTNGKRRPGLVIKEFGKGAAGNGAPGGRGPGDYAIVFTAAVPLPASLLRELARYSGTHVYDEEDDVVYADSTMVAVHAARPGPRRIALPAPTPVWDAVSGEALGEDLTALTFEVEAPVTRWFRFFQPEEASA
jgi:hypothetical protein